MALLQAIPLMLIAAGCISDPMPEYGDGDGWKVAVGDTLPAFEVTLNDGQRVSPETLRGDTAVICFFNTDCPDCQRELPLIQKEYENRNPSAWKTDAPDKPDNSETSDKSGICFICIARNEEAPQIQRYWNEHFLTLPYSAQSNDTIFQLFASWGIPRIIVADPEGRIIRLLDRS